MRIEDSPGNPVIRRSPHLDDDNNDGHHPGEQEYQRPRHQVDGCQDAQQREDPRPDQFQRARQSDDVTEQEEVGNDDANRDADPEVDQGKANCCDRTESQHHGIERGETEPRGECWSHSCNVIRLLTMSPKQVPSAMLPLTMVANFTNLMELFQRIETFRLFYPRKQFSGRRFGTAGVGRATLPA